MPHLMIYDISNNRQRQKVANKLLQYGMERIQLSVYIGDIQTSKLPQLFRAIEQLMKVKSHSKDKFMHLRLSKSQIRQMYSIGEEIDQDYLLGDLHTLVI